MIPFIEIVEEAESIIQWTFFCSLGSNFKKTYFLDPLPNFNSERQEHSHPLNLDVTKFAARNQAICSFKDALFTKMILRLYLLNYVIFYGL